jgi:hypothetical protein
MALPVVEVRVLADAQNLEGTDAPHRVVFLGVETVRDALPMLALLTKKLHPLKGVDDLVKEAAAEESGDDDDYDGSGDEHSDDDSSDENSHDDAEEEDEEEEHDEEEHEEEEEGTGNGGWIVDGEESLRDVAVLACLLEKVLYSIVPQLTRAPGDPYILRRLLANAKDIRRVALVLTAGQLRDLSLKLANRIKKTVSHSFQDKRGETRTGAQRTAWVAERLESMQDQARRLYEDYAVVLQ